MDTRLQRALDRYAGVPLCALVSFLERVLPARRRADAPPRRIVVILLSEMGSLVLARPMFARLRERYPQASIQALVFARNKPVLELLGVVAAEDILAIRDDSLGAFLADSWRALRTLRARPVDVALDCELFARISSLIAYLGGARLRVGFHRHTQEGLYRGSFINRPVLYNPYRHISRQFLTLVDAMASRSLPLGKEPDAGRAPPPAQLALPDGELRAATRRLHADFPALASSRLVLVNPGGGRLPIRAWPLAHYARLCAGLLREGCAVAITGMPEDRPLAQAITAACASPLCVDLTGYTRSVRELLLLMHRASLLVANDGGPAHFAALTPLPVLVLFGPETPLLYGPLARNATSLHLPLPCSPCLTAYNHRASPCDGDNQCLIRITPERVLRKAMAILAAEPAAAAGGPDERWRNAC